MPKRSDDTLLLVLSDKEASILRDIVDPPLAAGDKARLLQITIAILLLAVLALVAIGLFQPRLARVIAETLALLTN